MKRTNSWQDAKTTGLVRLDAGDGLEIVIPSGRRSYTVKETAGRTVTVWDYLNSREQLIYGDTGVRDISDSFVDRTQGVVYLSRTGAFVELFFNDLQTTLSGGVTPLVLPAGFRPPQWYYYRTTPYWDEETSDPFRIKADGAVQFRNLTAGNVLKVVLQFRTNEPWPTVLPGTAVGSITA